MKNLLNFGVSDPLTLGMAHPVADRLETLGRAKPASWTSRTLALSAMGAIAFASAPLSIAAEEPANEPQVKVITKGQSYELVDEDGEKRAYRILRGGDREEVGLTKKSDGSYQLTYEDGQTVDLPNIDMDRLAGLRGLAGLDGLEALEGLEGLEGLASLEGLEGLAALDGLDGLDGLKILRSIKSIDSLDGPEKLEKLKGLGFADGDVRVVTVRGLGAKDGTKLKIVRNRDGVSWVADGEEDGDGFELDDTVVRGQVEFLLSSDPIETAQHQLERTKRQLETLSDNESVSFDLQNALRDIESAQKSLEAAEGRLSQQDE